MSPLFTLILKPDGITLALVAFELHVLSPHGADDGYILPTYEDRELKLISPLLAARQVRVTLSLSAPCIYVQENASGGSGGGPQYLPGTMLAK
jgi:hypothetical protein